MKILFVAMMLVLSAGARAGEDYPPEVRKTIQMNYEAKQKRDQEMEQLRILWKKQAEKEAEELRPERERMEKERKAKAEEEKERTEKEAQIHKQREALEDAAREKEKEATKPKCTNIRFTGISTPTLASAAYFVNNMYRGQKRKYANTIEYVLDSHDIEDTLARNPIQCRYGNYISCQGFAYFKEHKGRIVNWDKNLYYVDAAVDFNSGRKNIELAVRRQDAVCVK